MAVTDLIKNAFDPYFNVPTAEWDSFVSLGEIITVEKEQIIKKNEHTETYLYFILKGAGGLLLWNKNNFVCIHLGYDNSFFGDYMSFLTQTPTPLEAVIFEKSTLFRISRKNFAELSDTELGNKICRFAAETLFIQKQQRQIDILTKTAKERYTELQLKQPSMIQRTPQKYIASYLGVTPQSLSRIRKELALH